MIKPADIHPDVTPADLPRIRAELRDTFTAVRRFWAAFDGPTKGVFLRRLVGDHRPDAPDVVLVASAHIEGAANDRRVVHLASDAALLGALDAIEQHAMWAVATAPVAGSC